MNVMRNRYNFQSSRFTPPLASLAVIHSSPCFNLYYRHMLIYQRNTNFINFSNIAVDSTIIKFNLPEYFLYNLLSPVATSMNNFYVL